MTGQGRIMLTGNKCGTCCFCCRGLARLESAKGRAVLDEVFDEVKRRIVPIWFGLEVIQTLWDQF